MIVEPFAQDEMKGNLSPIGRVLYSASTMIMHTGFPSAGGWPRAGRPGEKRIREVVTAGGFARFRRATETRFNIVYEARP